MLRKDPDGCVHCRWWSILYGEIEEGWTNETRCRCLCVDSHHHGHMTRSGCGKYDEGRPVDWPALARKPRKGR